MIRALIAPAAVLALAPAAVLASEAAPTLTADQQAIMAGMTASAAGWNAGSLDAFMAVYAPDAIYATSKGLVRGKAAIADRYRPSFAGGGNSRGKLSFQPLAFRTISNVHQLMVARWTLTPTVGDPETGLTTLLFERRPAGWRIISDHSS